MQNKRVVLLFIAGMIKALMMRMTADRYDEKEKGLL
jgi:hypothetical protein